MRLAKYLAHSGIASRRAAEALVRKGRVTVAGEVVDDPALDVDDGSGVAVDGQPVAPEETEVWALNKPAGVVSTASEPGSRRAVVELVPSDARLYPVGRLDADSTGLILVSNDGALANRLTHPSYEVPKTYRVELARSIGDDELEQLRTGVQLEDGRTAPAEARRLGEAEIEVTLREGRKRQVKRMALAVGNEVTSLQRLRIGSLELGRLAEGQARKLSREEVEALWKDAEDE